MNPILLIKQMGDGQCITNVNITDEKENPQIPTITFALITIFFKRKHETFKHPWLHPLMVAFIIKTCSLQPFFRHDINRKSNMRVWYLVFHMCMEAASLMLRQRGLKTLMIWRKTVHSVPSQLDFKTCFATEDVINDHSGWMLGSQFSHQLGGKLCCLLLSPEWKWLFFSLAKVRKKSRDFLRLKS